jgi:hypothetical protein
VRIDTRDPVIHWSWPAPESVSVKERTATLRGTVEDDNLESVTLDGARLHVSTDGSFRSDVRLAEGQERRYEIVARDRAGHEARSWRKLKREGPRTLVVPGDYGTIQAAMDAARPRDTVRLKPGVYRESVVLRDGVNLVGDDREGCILRLAPHAVAVLMAFDCGSGRIESLTLDARGDPSHRKVQLYHLGIGTDQKDPDQVSVLIDSVRSGSPADRAGLRKGMRILAVDDVALTAGHDELLLRLASVPRTRSVTLTVSGASGPHRVSLRTELLSASRAPGGIVLENSSVAVGRCRILGFPGNGVSILGSGSAPTVADNEVTGCKATGIDLVLGANGYIQRNQIVGNFDGVSVCGKGSRPRITANRIIGNEEFGVVW